jgi:hypothetical protein
MYYQHSQAILKMLIIVEEVDGTEIWSDFVTVQN